MPSTVRPPSAIDDIRKLRYQQRILAQQNRGVITVDAGGNVSDPPPPPGGGTPPPAPAPFQGVPVFVQLSAPVTTATNYVWYEGPLADGSFATHIVATSTATPDTFEDAYSDSY